MAARPIRAFCIGQAKSGTASLAGLLGRTFRATHEPERAGLLDMILRESRGEVDAAHFRTYLVERAARLDLDYDIAWANQFVVGHLEAAFPHARFVALVRHPRAWVVSVVGHLLVREIPPEVKAFLDWWFRPEEHPHAAGDAGLKANGLYSVSAFLHAWKRHVDLCLDSKLEDRLLVLRTDQLAESHGRLADFLEIRAGALDPGNGHLNRSTWSGRLATLVEPAHLATEVRSICGPHLERLFPELDS